MADPPPKKTPPPSPVTSSKNEGMGVLARRPDVFFDASDDVCPTPAWFSAATPRFTDILDDLKKWLATELLAQKKAEGVDYFRRVNTIDYVQRAIEEIERLRSLVPKPGKRKARARQLDLSLDRSSIEEIERLRSAALKPGERKARRGASRRRQGRQVK